jgi:hypothetical protein
MKTKTINQIGYLITGIASITLWGGDNGGIKMNPIFLKELPILPEKSDELFNRLNDGGFGVQRINGALVNIYELYEYNVKELIFDNVPVGEISQEFIDTCYDCLID